MRALQQPRRAGTAARPAGGKPGAAKTLLAALLVWALFLGGGLAVRAWTGAPSWSKLAPGEVLAARDAGVRVKPRDHAVLRQPAKAAADTLYIWDWADVDGDVVEVRVNGSTAVAWGGISHTPIRVAVPVPATVEVVGLRDGQGGITYALWFANLRRAIVNRAPEGGRNVYELLPR